MRIVVRIRMAWILSVAFALLVAESMFAIVLAQGQPWRHAIIEPKSDVGFAVMASKAGFAAKQGLNLELPPLQNDGIALRALLACEIESYEGGPGTAIIAASRNADVKIMGCHWQTVVHSVFARSDLKIPQDLKGAAFAISSPGALPDQIARAYLAQQHVPASDVRFASLGNDGERYKALLGGIVAATVISIEFLPIAERSGVKLLARGSDVIPKFIRLCTISTGKLLSARREDAIRFMAAEMMGFRHALANRQEEIRITREITGAKPDDPRPDFIFEEAAKPKTGVDPTMPIPIDKLEWMQEQLIKLGSMSQPYDIVKMVNTDIRAEALLRAGMR